MKPTSLTRYWLKKRNMFASNVWSFVLVHFLYFQILLPKWNLLSMCHCVMLWGAGDLDSRLLSTWTHVKILRRWALLSLHMFIICTTKFKKKDKARNLSKQEHPHPHTFCLESFQIKSEEMLRTNINLFFFKILLSLLHNSIGIPAGRWC